MSNSDTIQRILFEDIDVRGVVARLDQSYQDVLSRDNYPPCLQRLLGEMMAAVSLLSSTLKMDGRISLQAQGDGPLRLLMAECNQHHDLRAIARFEGDLADDATLTDLLGNGRFAMTLAPADGQRYQGVVPLTSPTLPGCLEGYFRQSEQLGTQVHLAADGKQAVGLLLQVMPAAQTGEEDWERVCTLASTVKDEELLELSNEEMLYRLFHQETCRLYEPEAMQFNCDCSRERSAQALKMMTQEELEALAHEHGGIVEMNCHFCNERYTFDTADIKALFSDKATTQMPQDLH